MKPVFQKKSLKATMVEKLEATSVSTACCTSCSSCCNLVLTAVAV